MDDLFRFTPWALPPLAGFVALAGFSLFVLARRPGGTLLAFALVNLATALWNLDIFLLYTLRDPGLALLTDRLFQPAVALIPLAWFNFVTAFLGNPRRRLLVTVLAAWSAVLAALSPTGLFIEGVRSMYFGHYGVAGPFYFLYAATHVTVAGAITVMLLVDWRREPEAERRCQIGHFLLATAVMGVLTADNFLPLYGVEKYPLGNIAVIIYVAIVWLAVTRHRFLNIHTLVRKSLVYTIATFLLTAVYLAGILLLEALVRVWLLPDSLVVPLVPALVTAFMFHGVKERVQARIDGVFGQERRRTSILSSFARSVPAAVSRRELAEMACRKMDAALEPARQALFVRDQVNGRWRAEAADLGAEDARDLAENFLPGACGGAEVVDIPAPGERPVGRGAGDGAARLGFRLLVPLRGRAGLCGACLLGPRRSGFPYAGEDRVFIAALAGQVALALEAREYYERWRREEKLTSLGRASATISHELRNPLNVIRGAVAYLRSRHREGEVARFAGIIGDEVDRTAQFIERFLRASRVPAARRVDVDLAGWARRAAAGWAAGKPGVTVSVIAPTSLSARLDPLLLQQLLENLLGNAAEAMGGQGEVRVTVEEDGGRAVLTVADGGPGVPEEDREHLFDPFFTTKATGTGLGLCLVDGVARAHGGRVEVESGPGGGALFRVVLGPRGEGGRGARHEQGRDA